jgi:hypothetical protein
MEDGPCIIIPPLIFTFKTLDFPHTHTHTHTTTTTMIQNQNQLQEVLHLLDNAIFNLSDSNDGFPSTSTNHDNDNDDSDIGTKVSLPHSKRRRNNNNNNNNNTIDHNDVSVLIGLERQYNELYSLLKRGLLGHDDDTNYNKDKEKNYDHSCSIGSENTDTDSHVNMNTATNQNPTKKRNVSALLLGPRGLGKSLVLEKCIHSLLHEYSYSSSHIHPQINQQTNQPHVRVPFRVIRLNGILLRGHDVNITVREIVRQLSEIASKESFERRQRRQLDTNTNNNNHNLKSTNTNNTYPDYDDDDDDDNQQQQLQFKLYKLLEKESFDLRTRKTTFNNALSILDEALKTACIDGIPILIIMDELDAFLNVSYSTKGTNHTTNTSTSSTITNRSSSSTMDISSKRHLLLYHLLDRVAGNGSLISLVSSTSRLSTIGMFEKRVKSRMEGTTKVIYFGRPETYDILVSILVEKIHYGVGGSFRSDISSQGNEVFLDHDDDDDDDDDGNDDLALIDVLKRNIRDILLPKKLDYNAHKHMDSDARQREHDKLFMVKNIMERNFNCGQDVRWFSRVMSISLSLYVQDIIQQMTKKVSSLPTLNGDYFINALQIMGGTNINPKIINISNNSDSRKHGSAHDDDDSDQIELMKGNPRINWLLDLSGPQVAVLLSAKRILHRDTQDEMMKPLTFERMLKEYESYFIAQSKSTGPDHYPEHIFFRSFCDLLGGFLMPIKDHSGGAPLQYQYRSRFVSGNNANLKKVSLYVNVDLDDELGMALKKNLLDCTSALRDWGLSGLRN